MITALTDVLLTEALELIGSGSPSIDLLLTDLGLPEGSGRDLAAALGEIAREIPVVFMSGYSPSEADGGPVVIPGERFIEKPFDPCELARMIRSVLDEGGTGLSRTPGA